MAPRYTVSITHTRVIQHILVSPRDLLQYFWSSIRNCNNIASNPPVHHTNHARTALAMDTIIKPITQCPWYRGKDELWWQYKTVPFAMLPKQVFRETDLPLPTRFAWFLPHLSYPICLGININIPTRNVLQYIYITHLFPTSFPSPNPFQDFITKTTQYLTTPHHLRTNPSHSITSNLSNRYR